MLEELYKPHIAYVFVNPRNTYPIYNQDTLYRHLETQNSGGNSNIIEVTKTPEKENEKNKINSQFNTGT